MACFWPRSGKQERSAQVPSFHATCGPDHHSRCAQMWAGSGPTLCCYLGWLRPNLDFRLGGYDCVRCDRREGVGGGCVTFVREDIAFREIGIGNEHEYIVIEIWTKEGELIIINYYNPCKKLDLNGLMQIEGMDGNKRVICGDFNAHSTLWGGTKTDVNGGVIEQLLEE